MCDLNEKVYDESLTGWKVVLVDDEGSYYSPAMGCKYPKCGPVPVVFQQMSLTEHFNIDILNRTRSYRPDMKGRTAVFAEKRVADDLSMDIYYSRFIRSPHIPTKHFPTRVAICKVKVTIDLMMGMYRDSVVYAGKHMEFVGEPEYYVPYPCANPPKKDN